MLSFYKIAKNTFLESIREPIFFIMLFSAFVLIGNLPGVTLFVFFQQMKMVVDSALATTMVFGMLILTLSASNAVAREMRNGTVLLLMSKPVHRWVFVAGKTMGVIFTGAVFCFLCNMASLIAIYTASDQFRFNMYSYVGFFAALLLSIVAGLAMNFWRQSSFSEIAIKCNIVLLPIVAILCKIFCETPEIAVSNVLKAMVLIFFAISIMGTLAVIFAIKFDIVANLILCSFMFFLGLMSNFLFNRETGTLIFDIISDFFYSVIPNWQYFWMADSVALGRIIPSNYILSSGVYAFLYIFIAMLWAVMLFQTREMAKDAR